MHCSRRSCGATTPTCRYRSEMDEYRPTSDEEKDVAMSSNGSQPSTAEQGTADEPRDATAVDASEGDGAEPGASSSRAAVAAPPRPVLPPPLPPSTGPQAPPIMPGRPVPRAAAAPPAQAPPAAGSQQPQAERPESQSQSTWEKDPVIELFGVHKAFGSLKVLDG